MSWDYDLDDIVYWDGTRTPYDLYWEYLSSYIKAFIAVLLVAAMILIHIPCHILAMAPDYQGDLTVEQFVSNYNQHCRFHTEDGQPITKLTADGTFQEIKYPGVVHIVVHPSMPVVFEFQTEDGIVKEVSFRASATEESISLPTSEMQTALWALLYGREDVSLSRLIWVCDNFPSISATESGIMDFNHLDLEGATLDVDYFYSGYSLTSWGALFAQEGKTPVCTVHFSIKLKN